MPGLQGLQQQVAPATGQTSIDMALAALSPEEQALVAAGIDPMGGDAGMMGGQVAPNPAAANPQGPAGGSLTPETRAAIGETLTQILGMVGNPQTEGAAQLSSSLQNAILALGVE